MATQSELEFIIKMRDEASKTLKAQGAALEQTAKQAAQLSTALEQTGAAQKKAATSAKEQATVTRQLGAVAERAANTLRTSAATMQATVAATRQQNTAQQQSVATSTRLKTVVETANTALRVHGVEIGKTSRAHLAHTAMLKQQQAAMQALSATTQQFSAVMATTTQAVNQGAAALAGMQAASAQAGTATQTHQARLRQNVVATNTAAKATQGLSNSLTEAASTIAIMDGPLGGIASRLTAFRMVIDRTSLATGSFVVAIGAMVFALGKGVAEAGLHERAMLTLEGRIKAAGDAAGRSAQQIETLLRDNEFLIDISQMREAAGELLTFDRISGDVFDRVLLAAQDMAQLGFGSVKSSAEQLARALTDPEKGLRRLERSGVKFSVSQEMVIESLLRTGQQAEAMEIILGRVEAKFKGAASDAAEGFDGAVSQLGGNLNKAFAAFVRVSGVTDTLTRILWQAVAAVRAVEDNMASIVKVTNAAGAALGAFLAVLAAGKGLIWALGVTKAALIATTVATTNFGKAFAVLNVIVQRNPLVLLATVAATAAGLMVYFRDEVEETTGAVDALAESMANLDPPAMDDETRTAFKNFWTEQERSLVTLQQQIDLQDQFGSTFARTAALMETANRAITAGFTTEQTMLALQQHADLYDRVLESQRGIEGAMRGARSAVQEFIDESTNSFETWSSITRNAIDGLTDAFEDFIRTGKVEWEDLILDMQVDIARAGFKEALAGAFQGLQGLTGGGGEGGSGGAFQSIIDMVKGQQALGASPANALYVHVVNAQTGADFAKLPETAEGKAQIQGMLDRIRGTGQPGDVATSTSTGGSHARPGSSDITATELPDPTLAGEHSLGAALDRWQAFFTSASDDAAAAVENSGHSLGDALERWQTFLFGGAGGAGPEAALEQGSQALATASEAVASSSGAAISELPAAWSEAQKMLFEKFSEAGFDATQIAGVMGNVARESSFNPEAFNAAEGAVGLFQHREDRLVGVARTAQDLGTTTVDPAAQIEHALRELQTTESRAGNLLRNASTVEESTAAMAAFERPAGFRASDPTATHDFAERLELANQSLTEMQEAASQAGASVGELGAQVLPATDALAQGADMAASATTSMADAGLEQAQEAVQGTAQQQILTQAATSAAGALVELTAAATAAAAAQSSAAGTEAASSGALLLGASTMHSGGLVGRDGKKSAWPAALFENAPRFHRGSLKNDEIASILQKGEVVLSKDQVSTIGRATEGSGMMGASGAELKRFVDQALGRDRQGFAGIETASFTRTGAARAGRADPQYGIDGFRTEQLLASRRHDPPPAAGNLTQSIARDRAPASGGATITNNFHISTPNADSFRLSQGQIMARAQTAMSQAQSRNR